MRGGPRVAWVWHRADRVYHYETTAVRVGPYLRAPCGAPISRRGYYRAEIGTARHAESIGLRYCRSCWPDGPPYSPSSGSNGSAG